MADRSISQLQVAGALTGDELTVVVQNGVTKQTQLQDISNLGGPPGPVGPQGPQGPAGTAATIQVQSTTTTAPGTNANVINIGTPTTAAFEFYIPRGDVGATGATGATGPAGPGVAAGGVAGQYLKKVDSTNYNTTWDTLPTYVSSVGGTANQIDVATGTTNAVLSISNNPVLPGTAAVKVPSGTTAERSGVSPTNGLIRYNSDTGLFEGFSSGSWQSFAAGSGVTSVATGTGLTGGPITSTGTISIANTAVTAGSYGSATEVGTFTVNAQGQLTAASNVSITAGGIGAVASVSGTANEITATGTTNVTLSLPTALTFTGKTVTGGTLTGVSINGSTNTLSNIGNGSLTNSSVTIGTTSISLGSSSLTLGGLTSVAVTQDPSTALQLATKQYVDTLVSSGITYHTPVKYEVPNTTGNLNATYNQPGGPGVGVGATLTNAGTLAAFAPDGPTALVGDRVLVYNQTNQFENGVYEVSVVGNGSTAWVLTRTTDADTYALKSTTGLGNGDAFFVTSGNTGAGETYVCNTTGVITFGTTAITFAQISSSQVYSAGTGLNLSPATTFNISNTGVTAATYGSASSVPTIAVNAQGQITSASNSSIAIDANQITSGTLPVANGGTGANTLTGYVKGSGTSAFTASSTIPTTDLSGTISNAQLANSAITINGTPTSLGGSISVGTVTSVSGTGTVSGISLSGTVTSSGSLTLGGTLDLSSPPAIGGTTPNAITGTTITATNYVGISGGTFQYGTNKLHPNIVILQLYSRGSTYRWKSDQWRVGN